MKIYFTSEEKQTILGKIKEDELFAENLILNSELDSESEASKNKDILNFLHKLPKKISQTDRHSVLELSKEDMDYLFAEFLSSPPTTKYRKSILQKTNYFNRISKIKYQPF